MRIEFPEKSSLTAHHRALIVGLGGSSASSSTDDIATIARAMAVPWNAAHPNKRAACVTGSATPFTPSRWLAERLLEVRRWIRTKSGAFPALVLVGKSMGGCKLHKVAERFAEDEIEVALFVGVDVSCHIARHYDRYASTGRDAKTYPATVRSLVSFYQTKAGEAQCGHVALWDGAPACALHGPRRMCRDYNIDVNEDPIAIAANGAILHTGSQTAAQGNVGHMAIDSDPRLVKIIRKIVERRVLARL